MAASLDAHQLDDLTRFITQRVGVQLNENQIKEIQRTVIRLLPSFRNFDHFLATLFRESWDSLIWQELLQIVTVGETYFFRNQDQFDALRSQVLPQLIEMRRKMGLKQLRIWSAGCASGEEIYSLAILLRELIPDLPEWAIYLLGTDINAVSLDRARRGSYRAWSFRNETPAYVRDRWFSSRDDTYTIHHALRAMVNFRLLNLISDPYPSIEGGTSHLDLIMFRNVSIYFDQPTTNAIINRLHSALVDDGWLVVGHAEVLTANHRGFKPHNFPNAVLYQKSAAPAQTEPLTVLPPTPLPKKTTPTIPSSPPFQPFLPSPPPEPVAAEQPQLTSWQQAKAAADAENWSEALKWLEVAERENRFRAEVHHLRALIQLHAGDLDAALASLRRAIYCDPKFAIAYYTLGEIHEKRKAYSEAARSWRQAREAVANLDDKALVPFSDDITAELFLSLIDYRLSRLPPAALEGLNVNL